jgi:hypothetical protein
MNSRTSLIKVEVQRVSQSLFHNLLNRIPPPIYDALKALPLDVSCWLLDDRQSGSCPEMGFEEINKRFL